MECNISFIKNAKAIAEYDRHTTSTSKEITTLINTNEMRI